LIQNIKKILKKIKFYQKYKGIIYNTTNELKTFVKNVRKHLTQIHNSLHKIIH